MGQVLGVAGDHRRDDAVHGDSRPIEEERVQCAAVDGPLDGLADADVVQGLRLAVEHHVGQAGTLEGTGQGFPDLALREVLVGGRAAEAHHVELSILEHHALRRRIDVDQVADTVDGGPLAEVLVVPHQINLLIGLPASELHPARSHGVLGIEAELLPTLGDGLAIEDRRRGVGQVREERSVGGLQDDLHGVVVDHPDPADRLGLAREPVLGPGDHLEGVGVERLFLRVHHLVDGEQDVVRLELRAVMELDPLAQVEGVGFAVRGDVPGFGQAGDDDRTALAVGLGLHEAAVDLERNEVVRVGLLDVQGPRILEQGEDEGVSVGAFVVLERVVLGRLGRGKCVQEKRGRGRGPNKARDESHDDGRPPLGDNRRNGAERTGRGRVTEEETPASGSLPTSGRTGRRCSTCTTHVRSRFRTTHRKVPLPTSTSMFNDTGDLRGAPST